VFAALFPSGSVTGAPKVAAMAHIAGAERSPRGVYCGAVGLVSPASVGVRARFAVAIRTAVVDRARGVVEYGSGGGITWDSDARAEWREVRLKAAVLGAGDAPGRRAARSCAGLIETMRFDPAERDHHPLGVRNLARHLDRLAASAAYYSLTMPPDLVGELAAAVAGLHAPARVRLVLRADGRVELTATPLADVTSAVADPVELCIDPVPLHSSDPALFHKTLDRRRYDERAARHPAADDVVLVNERGEVTETTRANLAARTGGRWITPPLACGLLPGIERARLLAAGQLTEAVLRVEDLLGADAVATFSSLRGWREATVAPTCPCAAPPVPGPPPTAGGEITPTAAPASPNQLGPGQW
jgi:para-aminobenzoate synthetase/4-amino-4-deoxychorismate lyase